MPFSRMFYSLDHGHQSVRVYQFQLILCPPIHVFSKGQWHCFPLIYWPCLLSSSETFESTPTDILPFSSFIPHLFICLSHWHHISCKNIFLITYASAGTKSKWQISPTFVVLPCNQAVTLVIDLANLSWENYHQSFPPPSFFQAVN